MFEDFWISDFRMTDKYVKITFQEIFDNLKELHKDKYPKSDIQEFFMETGFFYKIPVVYYKLSNIESFMKTLFEYTKDSKDYNLKDMVNDKDKEFYLSYTK